MTDRFLANRLSPHNRVKLVELQGLSQVAVARQLGLSRSGAKSRVQRARQKLKTLLLQCCAVQFDRCGNAIDYQVKTIEANSPLDLSENS